MEKKDKKKEKCDWASAEDISQGILNLVDVSLKDRVKLCELLLLFQNSE
jgi:hypothetical protein